MTGHICETCGALRLDKLPPAAVVVDVPIRTDNPTNGSRGHHHAHAEKVKKQRESVAMMLRTPLRKAGVVRRGLQGMMLAAPSVIVRLTRLAPSAGLDEHDNLRATLKGPVDAIAEELGLRSDRDARVTWLYDQKPSGKRGLYLVKVEVIRPLGDAP